MTAFDDAFEKTVAREGGYSNHPDDSGGETAYGITEAVARAEGYLGPMALLPLATAKAIYRRRYWERLHLEDVAALSAPIALELFDTGVNMGTQVAAQFLQRALNVFNRRQADYPDMMVDGLIGLKTIAALKAFLDKRKASGQVALLKALNSLQGARYIELAERREKDEAFVFGWIMNRL
ncbi:glycoside hydrolase family 108 protein [Mycetohabitans sp. B46]|uniref:glycoside hydrolase family 108 protein n=1 Tax=Mycetohabitans sp. B46 TaxID=2772536 RepID=UPI00307DEAF2